MASVVSLLLATLVAGTIYNLVDELMTGLRPFRPIHSFVTQTYAWMAFYFLASVAGGIALLFNLWFEPLVSVHIVLIVSLLFAVFLSATELRGSSRLREKLKEDVGDLVAFALLGTSTAAGTLFLLGLSWS